MKNKFSMAVTLAVVLALVVTAAVLADDLLTDGDALLPVVDTPTLNLGTVCTGTTVSKTILHAINATGHPGAGNNVYANNATVAVSITGVSGLGLNAGGGGGILLPSNWISLPNQTRSNPVSSGITFNAGATPRSFSGTVSYSATGPRSIGGSLTKTDSLTVTATVVSCDTTPPTLSLPGNMTVEATGASGAVVTFSATASDTNPLNPVVTCVPPSGSLFPLDVTTTMNCSATDAAGNTAYGSFTIAVVDTTPPTVTPPSGITAEATGGSGAVVSYSGESASDLVDGALTASCVPVSGSTFPLGLNTVTCSATDSHGNTGSSDFTIDVQDTTDPILALPADITEEATSASGAVVNFSVLASDLVDGDIAVSCDWNDGDTFPLGTTLVSCSATDSNSNTSNGSFNVNVVDTTPPSLTLPADFSVEATSSAGAVATFSASASDLVDGSVAVSCAPASASIFPLGPTQVACSASDAAGNTGTGSFNVTVVDTTPPTLTLPADQQLEAAGPSGAQAFFTPTAVDIVDGPLAVTCSANSGDTFPLGTTTVNCSVSDAAGNMASGSFVIIVVDTTPPDFSCGSADSIWHADNQSVACTASDSGSGLAAPASFSLNTSVTAGNETDSAYTDSQSVCDVAGNCVTAGPVGPFKIDRKAPSVSATPDRAADFGGWYNHALTITFSGTDGGSGGVTCDPVVNYAGPDNASASVSGSCSDAVGNSASASFDFMYDGTAPTAALSVTAGTPGANGWYTSNVTVHTSGVGSVSGVTCSSDQYQTDETTGTVFNGSCASGAGLTTNADPLTIKLDKTGPTAVLSASGTLGLNGWYISDVTISTSGTDTISAPVTCTADQSQVTDTIGVTFNGSCTNDAGLTTAASSLTVKRDTVAPSISASVSQARPASGWWNITSGAPTVSFTCNDATSGVVACPAAYTFGEGENQAFSGTVYDNAGHSASAGVADIDVDLTPPSLTWIGGPADGGNYDFGFVPAAPICTAADALSGPNGCTIAGYANTVGPHTMTATAYDVAGNVYSETRSYNVEGWVLKGFYQPVDMFNIFNVVKNGSTVPLKFKIFRQVDGSEITDVSFVKSLMYARTACNTTAITDDIETIATGGTVLRYDFTAGQFIFNWKTPALAGKCYRVTMTTLDGSSLVAYFRLK